MNAHSALLPVCKKTTAHIAFSKAPSGASYVSHQEVGYPFHLGRTLKAARPARHGGDLSAIVLGRPICRGNAAPATARRTVAHSMLEQPARQSVMLTAETGALLEYLPMATILFPQARLHSVVNVTLHPNARVMLCDAFCLHVPPGSAGLPGFYRADLHIHCPTGKLLAGDRLALTGADLHRRLPGGSAELQALAHFHAGGSGFACGGCETGLARRIARRSRELPGVSALPNDCGVSVRIMTADAVALRQLTGITPRVRRK